jgi:hypothetical protein
MATSKFVLSDVAMYCGNLLSSAQSVYTLQLPQPVIWPFPCAPLATAQSACMQPNPSSVGTTQYRSIASHHLIRKIRSASPCVTKTKLVLLAKRPALMSRIRWSVKTVMRSYTSAPDSPFGNLQHMWWEHVWYQSVKVQLHTTSK